MKHDATNTVVALLSIMFLATMCGKETPAPDLFSPNLACSDTTVIPGSSGMTLGQLARVFAGLPLGEEHLKEVHDAAQASLANGYDEEYTLHQIFEAPGCGVGDPSTKAVVQGSTMRDLLTDYFRASAGTKAGEGANAVAETKAGAGADGAGTKAGAVADGAGTKAGTGADGAGTKAGAADADAILEALSESDVQIYWPYSQDWDGSYPIITFDPGYGSEYNYGYMIEKDEDGLHVMDSVFVDEDVARHHAVWVINTNDDAAYSTEDVFLASDSSCDNLGRLCVNADSFRANPDRLCAEAGSSYADMWDGDSSLIDTVVRKSAARKLMFKSITTLRNYDSWFRGASEFWIKCGSVNGFSASTEAELKLYSPSVTDFMIVVPRKYLNQELEVNSIIMTNFTNQLDNLAFLITEDDGGTQSNWKCSATVKIKSKSYGFDVDIPYNEKDDIVWRGQLSASFFQSEDIVTGRFGDVILSFALE